MDILIELARLPYLCPSMAFFPQIRDINVVYPQLDSAEIVAREASVKVTIYNNEIENRIIMERAHIACGRRIVNSLIGRKVKILGYERNKPKGHKLILGDMATVTL